MTGDLVTADVWLAWTPGAVVIVALGVTAYVTVGRAERRRISETRQSEPTTRPDSASSRSGAVLPAAEHPLPGVRGAGNRENRSESEVRYSPTGWDTPRGPLWAIPPTEPDHGPALVAYRDWLDGAQKIAAEHAGMLSSALQKYPERDDPRWCLLHQAIGRAAAYRTALSRLPDEPGRLNIQPGDITVDHLDAGSITSYGLDPDDQ